MKPCANKRKLIALLVLNTLDAQPERALRAHLETCAGCRLYLNEVANLTKKLAAPKIRSDIQTSASFHHRVVVSLSASQPDSTWETALAHLRALWLNWRVALPIIGATAAFIAVLTLLPRHVEQAPPAHTGSQTSWKPNVKGDLDPSVSNYQRIANRSLEKLDELLTRQGTRNLAPAPVYTASSLGQGGAWD